MQTGFDYNYGVIINFENLTARTVFETCPFDSTSSLFTIMNYDFHSKPRDSYYLTICIQVTATKITGMEMIKAQK